MHLHLHYRVNRTGAVRHKVKGPHQVAPGVRTSDPRRQVLEEEPQGQSDRDNACCDDELPTGTDRRKWTWNWGTGWGGSADPPAHPPGEIRQKSEEVTDASSSPVDLSGDAAPFEEGKHPRNKSGEFAKGGSGGSGSGGSGGGSSELKKTTKRAWTGRPKPEAPRLGKQEAGALGEKIAADYVSHILGQEAKPLNTKQSNFPIDLAAGSNVYEIKTGQVTNPTQAQQWRATIGQPGKAESAYLATLGPEEKRAWNERKERAIMDRKLAAVKQIEKETGRKVSAKTLTLILDPSSGTADIFEFDGFHKRIGYNSPQAKEGYVGSFSYLTKSGGDSRTKGTGDRQRGLARVRGSARRVGGSVPQGDEGAFRYAVHFH